MSFSSLDELVAGMKPSVPFRKASATTEGAGTYFSLWALAGFPGAGATPPTKTAGSGYAPTNATPGALPFTNPVTANSSALAGLDIASSVLGTYWLYDRCWACSGFDTTLTSAQSITTPGTHRYNANPTGVELFGEVYTAPGATAASWTASYTNQDGTAGRSATYAHPANAETVGQMLPFTLAAGDTGVQSVQSLTCSVSSGTAGNIGLTLVRRAKAIPILTANVGGILDAIGCGVAPLLDNICLAVMMLCGAATSGEVAGTYIYAQK